MKTETISSLATRLYDDCGHDEDKAIEALIKYASTRDSYREELIYLGAKSLVTAIYRSDRNAVLVRESKPFVPTKYAQAAANDAMDRAKNMSNYIRSSFMEMPFKVNGQKVRLGDMDAESLMEVAKDYIQRGTTMVKRGNWLSSISQGLPKGKIVRKVYQEQELKEMYETA